MQIKSMSVKSAPYKLREYKAPLAGAAQQFRVAVACSNIAFEVQMELCPVYYEVNFVIRALIIPASGTASII